MRSDSPALLAARVGRVDDEQWNVILFSVRHRAFGVKLMCAVHIAVIRSKNNDRPVAQPRSVKLSKYRSDIAVDVAQAIQVVIVPPTPACFFIRY
ncbi:hypothetical protein D3C71_996900 [compost metagenome]